jgi:hypothetical protein
MSDLEALFGAVDGIKDDAMEFGVIGASAVGAHIAYGYIAQQPAVAKILGYVPEIARPLVPVALGIAAGRYLGRIDRRVATGAAVGLVAVGIRQLVAKYAPASVAGALAGADEEVMLQAVTVEDGDLLNGYLNGAPITMEQVNGLDDVSEVSFGSPFGAQGGFTGAATLVG